VRERIGPGLPHVENELIPCARQLVELRQRHGWLDVDCGKRLPELHRTPLGSERVGIDMNPLLRSGGDALPARSDTDLAYAERSAAKPGDPCLHVEYGAVRRFDIVYDGHLVNDERDPLIEETRCRPARVDRGKRRRVLAETPDVRGPWNLACSECITRKDQWEFPKRVRHRPQIAVSNACATARLSL
jgi:hypothetical protein